MLFLRQISREIWPNSALGTIKTLVLTPAILAFLSSGFVLWALVVLSLWCFSLGLELEIDVRYQRAHLSIWLCVWVVSLVPYAFRQLHTKYSFHDSADIVPPLYTSAVLQALVSWAVYYNSHGFRSIFCPASLCTHIIWFRYTDASVSGFNTFRIPHFFREIFIVLGTCFFSEVRFRPQV